MLPNFYNPDNAGKWGYRPDITKLAAHAADYRSRNNIESHRNDKKRIAFLGIDLQKDFCLPDGTLYVGGRSGTGAIDDTRRIAEFIYGNMGLISHVAMTLDTHYPFQIFYASFWNDSDGNPAQPFTAITADEIENGTYVLNPVAAQFAGGSYTWGKAQAKHYADELKKAGKYTLYLWPYHCMLSSEGHALTGLINEVTMFHGFVRGAQPEFALKGSNPWTECYSVFGAEVLSRWDGKGAIDQKNVALVQTLLDYDYVIVGGEASSHCVFSSLNSLIEDIQKKDPKLAEKVYVLTDCMSAVTVPDGNGGFFADYTQQAEDAFKHYESVGLNLVKSTDPIQDWKGIKL